MSWLKESKEYTNHIYEKYGVLNENKLKETKSASAIKAEFDGDPRYYKDAVEIIQSWYEAEGDEDDDFLDIADMLDAATDSEEIEIVAKAMGPETAEMYLDEEELDRWAQDIKSSKLKASDKERLLSEIPELSDAERQKLANESAERETKAQSEAIFWNKLFAESVRVNQKRLREDKGVLKDSDSLLKAVFNKKYEKFLFPELYTKEFRQKNLLDPNLFKDIDMSQPIKVDPVALMDVANFGGKGNVSGREESQHHAFSRCVDLLISLPENGHTPQEVKNDYWMRLGHHALETSNMGEVISVIKQKYPEINPYVDKVYDYYQRSVENYKNNPITVYDGSEEDLSGIMTPVTGTRYFKGKAIILVANFLRKLMGSELKKIVFDVEKKNLDLSDKDVAISIKSVKYDFATFNEIQPIINEIADRSKSPKYLYLPGSKKFAIYTLNKGVLENLSFEKNKDFVDHLCSEYSSAKVRAFIKIMFENNYFEPGSFYYTFTKNDEGNLRSKYGYLLLALTSNTLLLIGNGEAAWHGIVAYADFADFNLKENDVIPVENLSTTMHKLLKTNEFINRFLHSDRGAYIFKKVEE